MPNRYRFDLESDQDVILDETGVVADDIDMATEEALVAIRELHASGELLESDDKWDLVIRDDVGAELKRLPL